MRLGTRGLKIVTTIFFVSGMLLLILWPMLLGPRPHPGATRLAFRSYSYRTLEYMCALLISAVGSGIGAIALYRRIRSEYQAEAVKNLRALIEGSVAEASAKEERSERGRLD